MGRYRRAWLTDTACRSSCGTANPVWFRPTKLDALDGLKEVPNLRGAYCMLDGREVTAALAAADERERWWF